MDWFLSLFIGGGIAHTVLVLSLVIAIGVFLGKIKIAGISIGVTWILFVGILAGHLGMSIDSDVLHFIKEFGLILFVFSIGLQVGPGFFSSFKDGGMKMVGCAIAVVVLGALTTYNLLIQNSVRTFALERAFFESQRCVTNVKI